MAAKKNPYRLPRNVAPTSYELALELDLEKFAFIGSEAIQINVKKPTSKITLHAVGLKIESASLEYGDFAEDITYDKKMETATLHFKKPIKRGENVLWMRFKGEINDKMNGLYRTSYEISGEKRWGAATQFEATDARRCFPCWDEPDLKATFKVTLTVPSNLTALNNMPIAGESNLDGGEKKRIFFARTPLLPTYLVAFVVADLKCIEGYDSNGVHIRVWTTPGKEEHGQFALEAARHTLPYFAEWYGIPYPFPKLDMVALPDFAAGAMENPGLVTFRETALLIDPKNSSAAARQRVAEVVDHELAHMWFGDYATMKWWTHLWLNEGYASYMGPKAVAHQFPEWDFWTQYVADEYVSALHEDALRSTHPIEIEVKNPYEIREVFDAITYSKGSVVNRMLEHYLGEENFRKGLNLYLRRHAFANATTNELWRALGEASGKPVEAIMASYTRQPGYPVLVVNSERDGNKLTLNLEQKRFLLDGSKDKDGLRWKIPIGVLTAKDTTPKFEYMGGKKMTVSVEAGENDWVKLNPGQSGFYRVAYPPDMMKRLTGAAQELPTVDRLGLLDDAFALARAGYIKTSTALELLDAYKYERNFSVWMTVASAAGSMNNLLYGEPRYPELKVYLRNLFGIIAGRLGWKKLPTDTHLDVLLRSLALRNFGGYGNRATINTAEAKFEEFIATGELDPDLRQTVYSLVAENNGPKALETLMKIYNSTDMHEEKVRILRSMGSFNDKETVKEVLKFSFSEKVRSQDGPILLISVGMNPANRKATWEFVKKNWKKLLDRYERGGLGLMTRLLEVTAGFTKEEELKDVSAFFKTHRFPGADRTMKQSLEMIKSNIAWLNRDREDIKQWLADGRTDG